MGHIKSPLMCNGFSGVHSSAETENPQSYPTNPVIEVEFKSPNDVHTVPGNIDEELCMEKECDSVAELLKYSSSRDQLKDTSPQLNNSRADQDSSRASLTPVKARSPHS